jgi:hypothetical protein
MAKEITMNVRGGTFVVQCVDGASLDVIYRRENRNQERRFCTLRRINDVVWCFVYSDIHKSDYTAFTAWQARRVAKAASMQPNIARPQITCIDGSVISPRCINVPCNDGTFVATTWETRGHSFIDLGFQSAGKETLPLAIVEYDSDKLQVSLTGYPEFGRENWPMRTFEDHWDVHDILNVMDTN